MVLLPLLYVVFISFTTRTDSWQISKTFTLENYAAIINPLYAPILLESFKVAAVTTAICVVIGYPTGLFMAGLDDRRRDFFIKANMLPFLFNSMMRICGLIIILRKDGVLESVLGWFGADVGDMQFLYTFPAVITGMVYVLLPIMIYSVFSSASKLCSDKLEAAAVLGANRFRAFLDITLPLSAGGLLNGVVLCFIPSMGLYIVTSLLGGGKLVIISNVIEDQILKVRNLPFGAALSVALVFLSTCFVFLAKILDPVAGKKRKAARLSRNGGGGRQ